MACKHCGSDRQNEFRTEISIHGHVGLNKPAQLVFPRLAICSHCGFTEFMIAEDELRLLMQGVTATSSRDNRGQHLRTDQPTTPAISHDWRELCRAALLESDKRQRTFRIDEAERALTRRVRELHAVPNADTQECQAVDRALYGLRALRSCLRLKQKKAA
jgi:hypothetical protein